LHGQEDVAVVLAEVVDAADVGVRHLAGGADLVAEAGEPLRVGGESLRQQLQGDVLLEPAVEGTVDLAHGSAAQQRHDAVSPRRDVARRERGALRRRGPGRRRLGRGGLLRPRQGTAAGADLVLGRKLARADWATLLHDWARPGWA